MAQIINLPGAANEVLRTRTYSEVDGSPYLIDDWLSGIVTDKNGKEYGNLLIRFDTYKNNVEVSSPNGTLIVTAELYPNFIIQLVDKLGKVTVRSFVSNINPAEPLLYVEKLAGGKYSFYKQIKTELVEETVKTYGTAVEKKVFNPKVVYWIKANGEAKAVKLSKSSIIENFSGLAPSIEDFQKKTRSKLKSEADWVNFFNSLNSTP
jgi:hypothetical protein